MDTKRRDFLKIAGATTLAGLGGPVVVERLVSGTSPAQARAAHGEHSAAHGAKTHTAASGHEDGNAPTGKRLGMVEKTAGTHGKDSSRLSRGTQRAPLSQQER